MFAKLIRNPVGIFAGLNNVSFALYLGFSITTAIQFTAYAQTTEEKATLALERANTAAGTARQAEEAATRAEIVANDAAVNSKMAIELSDRRFNSIERSLYIVSAIATLLVVIASVFEHQRRSAEQNRFQKLLTRQDRLDKIHIDMGTKVNDNFDKSFKSQLENIEKIGAVINLVQKTFEFQREAAQKQTEIETTVQKFDGILQRQQEISVHQFERLYADIKPLAELSRVQWTNLSSEEHHLINLVQLKFETINAFGMHELQDSGKVAHVNYLLGVASFCKNDVLAALEYLNRARSLYDGDGGFQSIQNTPHHYPYIFCHHYLGIINKSWWDSEIRLEVNFQKAKNYLETALDLLKSKRGETLTQVTYAEILSYIDGEKPKARAQLLRLIDDLQKRQDSDNGPSNHMSSGLTNTQLAALSRAYLILGNLEYVDGNLDGALKNYDAAIHSVDENFYAWLSKGMVLKKIAGDDANMSLINGVERLLRSSALTKPEITVKGTLLAWLAIASHQIDDRQKESYRRQFIDCMVQARQLGSRIPMFFCPVSKKPVVKTALQTTVEQYT